MPLPIALQVTLLTTPPTPQLQLDDRVGKLERDNARLRKRLRARRAGGRGGGRRLANERDQPHDGMVSPLSSASTRSRRSSWSSNGGPAPPPSLATTQQSSRDDDEERRPAVYSPLSHDHAEEAVHDVPAAAAAPPVQRALGEDEGAKDDAGPPPPPPPQGAVLTRLSEAAGLIDAMEGRMDQIRQHQGAAAGTDGAADVAMQASRRAVNEYAAAAAAQGPID